VPLPPADDIGPRLLFADGSESGQMVCPAINDRMQYEWMLDRARELGETKIVQKPWGHR
jgi:hypothetical protein